MSTSNSNIKRVEDDAIKYFNNLTYSDNSYQKKYSFVDTVNTSKFSTCKKFITNTQNVVWKNTIQQQ